MTSTLDESGSCQIHYHAAMSTTVQYLLLPGVPLLKTLLPAMHPAAMSTVEPQDEGVTPELLHNICHRELN
jgi:hypothetical protein